MIGQDKQGREEADPRHHVIVKIRHACSSTGFVCYSRARKTTMTDLRFNFGTDILVLRSCYNPDGSDLLAIAGEDSLQVIQCVSIQLAQFCVRRNKQHTLSE